MKLHEVNLSNRTQSRYDDGITRPFSVPNGPVKLVSDKKEKDTRALSTKHERRDEKENFFRF